MRVSHFIVILIISFWTKNNFAQSEIGLGVGLQIDRGFYVGNFDRPRLNLDQAVSLGHNYNFFYQSSLRRLTSLRWQLQFSTFSKEFRITNGSHFFSSSTSGEFRISELNIGLLPIIRILASPEIRVGLGINYSRQIINPTLRVINKGTNFLDGSSSESVSEIKQLDILNRNGLGIITNVELNKRIKSDLYIQTGMVFQFRLTRLAKSSVTEGKIYMGRYIIRVGLIKKL